MTKNRQSKGEKKMNKVKAKKAKMSTSKHFRKGSTIQQLFDSLKTQSQIAESILRKKFHKIDLDSRLTALARRGKRVKAWELKRKNGKVQLVVKDKSLLKTVTA